MRFAYDRTSRLEKASGGRRLSCCQDGGPWFAHASRIPGGQEEIRPSRHCTPDDRSLRRRPRKIGPLLYLHTQEVEGLGAWYQWVFGANTFGLNGFRVSAVLPEVMERFVDVISAPAFDEGDVEFTRAELVRSATANLMIWGNGAGSRAISYCMANTRWAVIHSGLTRRWPHSTVMF